MKHMQTFGFVPSRAVPCRSFSGWEAAAAELFLVIHLLLLWCSGHTVRYGDARSENSPGCEGMLEVVLTWAVSAWMKAHS